MKRLITVIACLSLLGACARQGNNVYKEGEVGISRAIEYGTVQAVREVEIEPKNTGVGTLGGAAVGAGAGSYVGSGSGNAWATAGAAVAGAIIGTVAEREINRTTGYKYTILMQNGETKAIVQAKAEDEPALRVGQKVSVEYCDGGSEHTTKCAAGSTFQRIEPVDSFPSYSKKKRKVVKG